MALGDRSMPFETFTAISYKLSIVTNAPTLDLHFVINTASLQRVHTYIWEEGMIEDGSIRKFAVAYFLLPIYSRRNSYRLASTCNASFDGVRSHA
jgi:hypothetical protein